MSVSRPSGEVGKCRMIRHNRDKKNEPNPQRFDRINHTKETMNKDGINSLSYQLVDRDLRRTQSHPVRPSPSCELDSVMWTKVSALDSSAVPEASKMMLTYLRSPVDLHGAGSPNMSPFLFEALYGGGASC
uniref:Uncharacterized protein n=1 Tax=Oryzias sinensis TaxID=183150 RepID=A0A8C7WXZ2_9TELE